MEDYLKSSNTRRFVIEDSITKVTSDGEPHEVVTLIAGLSGLFAAFVILAILVFFIGYKKREGITSSSTITSTPSSPGGISELGGYNTSQRSSILPIFPSDTYLEETRGDSSPRLISVSVISGNKLNGNLNSAFVGNELDLGQKKIKFSDDIIDDESNVTKLKMPKF